MQGTQGDGKGNLSVGIECWRGLEILLCQNPKNHRHVSNKTSMQVDLDDDFSCLLTVPIILVVCSVILFYVLMYGGTDCR